MIKPLNLQDPEKIEEVYKEQILSAEYMIKKMFKNNLTQNEQHIVREQLPMLLACNEDPYPFEPIGQFFNYFEENSKQQELDSGFAIHNTCKEFDLYIKRPT